MLFKGGGEEARQPSAFGSEVESGFKSDSSRNSTQLPPSLPITSPCINTLTIISSAKREERGRSLNSWCSVTDRVETKGRRGASRRGPFSSKPWPVRSLLSLCWPPALGWICRSICQARLITHHRRRLRSETVECSSPAPTWSTRLSGEPWIGTASQKAGLKFLSRRGR